MSLLQEDTNPTSPEIVYEKRLIKWCVGVVVLGLIFLLVGVAMMPRIQAYLLRRQEAAEYQAYVDRFAGREIHYVQSGQEMRFTSDDDVAIFHGYEAGFHRGGTTAWPSVIFSWKKEVADNIQPNFNLPWRETMPPYGDVNFQELYDIPVTLHVIRLKYLSDKNWPVAMSYVVTPHNK